MRSLLVRGIVVGFCALLSVASYAGWQCKVENARGQVWYGTASTRSVATAQAMQYCANNSTYARNCVVDFCRIGNYTPTAGRGSWQCNATNARGQLWIGTGSTRAVAAANASGYCAGHSRYARNCVINGCFVRY